MTFVRSKTIIDERGLPFRLNPFIVCEDEFEVPFKIVFLHNGIKFQELTNPENQETLYFNFN